MNRDNIRSNFVLNTWLCYYKSADNMREGVEIIHANSRDEAIELYRRFFNVNGEVVCVPRIDTSKA